MGKLVVWGPTTLEPALSDNFDFSPSSRLTLLVWSLFSNNFVVVECKEGGRKGATVLELILVVEVVGGGGNGTASVRMWSTGVTLLLEVTGGRGGGGGSVKSGLGFTSSFISLIGLY